MLHAELMKNGAAPDQFKDGPLSVRHHQKSGKSMQGVVELNECKSTAASVPDKDGLKMATAVTRPAIARPLPESASKTYVTCAPVLSHSSTNGMKTNRQQIRKAHSLPGGPLNLAANKTPPFARHTRPAGTTTPCQDTPLDLTKPLDLSVKNKPVSQSREITKSYGLNKCYRETHMGSLSQKSGPAVVTPFNFTNLNKAVPLVRTHEHSCSRRTGLMASSPRNYNHKGRAMVAPRREHAPEIHHAKQQLLDPPRENSALLKHSHIPVHSQSVPYSHVTHSLSQANSFPITTSSSGHMLLPPYQPVSTNSIHAMHHELRHKPILPKPAAVARPIAPAASITSSISEGQIPPARIAHVSAFSHTSTTFAHTLTPTAQSHSASSFGLPGQLNARMQHGNQTVGFQPPSSTSNISNVNRYTNSISNGNLAIQKKRMRRSHSVSPMRPSRSTYKKESDRNNIRVLKMLESSIAAGAKIHKLLKPIDGPEASQLLSGDTRTFKEDSNNNHAHGMVTYSQPLRVDIPEQHSPNVPPSLPNAFSNDRMLTLADHIESAAYSACKMHQLSPPPNTLPNDRISPTMPVLVPHSMYSPGAGELPAAATHDSNLPVLKNAKLEGSTHPSPSVFNPLTLPFLTTVADSRKVQTVPPIISEPRKQEEPRSARHSQHSLHRDTTSVSRMSAHEEIPGMNHRARQELDRLLMQLDRKTAAAVAIQRKNMANAQASHSTVTKTRPYVANTSNSTIPYPKPSLHVSNQAEHRSLEEDREIFRKMLMQKRDLRKQALEMRAKQHFGSIHKQEPEVVDLTSSPPRSPEDKKQDVYIVPQEGKRYSNVASLHKPNQKPEQPPVQGQIKTANSVGRYPCLDVAGKSLTVKEAIEAAYGSPISEAQTKQNGKVEIDKQTNPPTETDYARPISLVVNTKLLSDSEEHPKKDKTADSYCKRHKQLLFPNTKKVVTVAQSVPDLLRKPQTTTLSQVITDHFVTHDPRKKHLATLNTRRNSPSTIPLVPSKENPSVSVQSVTEAATPPQAHSPQLPNGDNVDPGRRRKLTLEINRIANTASYVGDLPKKPRTGDLLVDSSLLDREERALQRAMLRFSEMEQQERLSTNNINNNNNNEAVQQDTVQKVSSEQKKLRPARGRPPRGRGRGGLCRATKVMKVGRKAKFPWRLARPQMPRRESPRKHALKISNPVRDTQASDGYQNDGTKQIQKSQKFDDFKPEILEARTRNAGTNLDETSPVPYEPALSKIGERGRNSVRRRTPYHKNARYELEIEKEEAKLVERKRKRTVSYGSNSGADTTDESSNNVSPQQIKRRRGRPRKNDSQRVLVAATGRRIKIKYKGVGRGRYPRVKKILPRRASRSNTAHVASTNEALIKNGYCSSDNSVNSSPFNKGSLQRPLQVVMDPDNHTKMKFVSVPRRAQLKKAAAAAILNNKPSGKRKRKTKHLGPVSPCPIGNTEDIDDVYTFKQENEDDNDPKKVELTKKVKENLSPVKMKQEPEDNGYEPEPVSNQPPPVQIVRPDPPPDLKKLICNKKLGETVLHRACRMARDEVAIYCIDYQMCDINAKDNAGYTPLHECCVNGRLEVAEHLLRHGADVNASAADGTRPLHDAVDNHRIEIVRLLLAFGADPLVATYSGRTALKLARTKQMRTFIVGYLRDVNGQWEVDEEEYPNYKDATKDTQWRFRSSYSTIETKAENQPIVKDDIPDDDATDAMFELSDTPHLPTYNLELARDNGPRNWLILSDVKKALGGKFDDVINTCEDIQPISITRREFNYALKEGLTSLTGDDLPPKVHGHVSDSDTVELVELNDSIRHALGIDTEFVR